MALTCDAYTVVTNYLDIHLGNTYTNPHSKSQIQCLTLLSLIYDMWREITDIADN